MTMGDSYGKKESLRIMERACNGFDTPVIEMKQKIESIYLGGLSASARAKSAAASRLGVRGFGVFADNVDLVSLFENFFPHPLKTFSGFYCYLPLPLSVNQLAVQHWLPECQPLPASDNDSLY